MKPEGSRQGKGISLVRSWQEVDWGEDTKSVCQKYMRRPLLIDGLKFDMRFYVLVTSIDPLRVFLHEEGFLRFCTVK